MRIPFAPQFSNPSTMIAATLAVGHVYVVRVRLDAPPVSLADFAEVVSPEERLRAACYHRDADAQRHLIGRGLLRYALAPHVGESPEAIQLQFTAMGKPFLDGGPSFNVSHSGNVIAIALSNHGRLGIDVEAVRDLDDLTSLATSAFCVDECIELANLPKIAQLRSFYRIWVRKEALLKALGLGLSAASTISVSGAEDIENALIRLSAPNEVPDAWSVRSIASPAGVESAVAWDRPIQTLEIVDL